VVSPAAAKAVSEKMLQIAEVNRCATQNQVQRKLFLRPARPSMTVLRIHRLLLALLLPVACWADSGSPVMTPAQYGAELDRLTAATQTLQAPGPQIPELLTNLPPNWEVQSERGKFEISTYWLERDLHQLEDRFDADLQKDIVQHLQSLRADLDAYEEPPNDVAKQRSVLAGILARPEFRDIHGPSWIERLKLKLLEFIFRLLERIFTSSSIPTVGKIFVYSLIGLAVLVVAVWVYRSMRTSAAIERVVPGEQTVSAKEWTVWMAEARAAAQEGNWRDAIHLAYWAGISFLEAGGMWRPDRARTPREYLRLLPASSGHQPALAALTREFEVVWYGNREADSQAFSQTLEELERLGCR